MEFKYFRDTFNNSVLKAWEHPTRSDCYQFGYLNSPSIFIEDKKLMHDVHIELPYYNSPLFKVLNSKENT